jgi:hypothetical protein
LAVLIEIAGVEANERVIDASGDAGRVTAAEASDQSSRAIRRDRAFDLAAECAEVVDVRKAGEVDGKLLAQNCCFDAIVDRVASVVDRYEHLGSAGAAERCRQRQQGKERR